MINVKKEVGVKQNSIWTIRTSRGIVIKGNLAI